jgi:DNA polymerase III alpha subunit
LEEDDLLEVFYRGHDVNGVVVEDGGWISKFNRNCAEFGLPFTIDWSLESAEESDEFVQRNLSNWHLPVEYQTMDMEAFLLSKCTTPAAMNRVRQELGEFKQRNMMNVLRWLKYFVDTMRANNMVWGVGRGSSVSSYVLFLMDVHRVDSLKYNLDIKEFLK